MTAPIKDYEIFWPDGNDTILSHLIKGPFADKGLFELRLKAENMSLIRGFEKLISLDAISVTPFPYQLETAKVALRRFRGRGFLCDEVGLGKTIEAGLVLKEYIMRGLVRKVLILTPPALVAQWRDEMDSKFHLDFMTHEDPRFKELGTEAWVAFERVIASLPTARSKQHRPVIEAIQYDMVIVDEAHRLELDRARLNDFYDETRKELEQRLRRAEGDEEKRRSIEEKLAFTEMERERKLADIEAKHRLRVVLELINAALISLPKLVTRVQVENRYVSVQRDFIWNPLIHRLEEPLCEICRRPTRHLHLCAGGHLACGDCILNCSACKREYCRLCEDQMGACAVCGRALCLKSQIKCRVCSQVTCRDHQGECH